VTEFGSSFAAVVMETCKMRKFIKQMAERLLRSAVRFQDYASPTMRLLLLLITLHLCTSICYCLVVPKPLCGLKQQQFAFHTASTLRAGASIDPMLRDAAVSALVASESFVWLKLWGALASSGVLDSKLTRKIIHTGSAPLFIAHWPLYSSAPSAKYLAVAVPLLQTIRFVYHSFLLVVYFTAHRSWAGCVSLASEQMRQINRRAQESHEMSWSMQSLERVAKQKRWVDRSSTPLCFFWAPCSFSGTFSCHVT
jgi:hypothetical protein